MGIPSGTTAEINAITTAQIGSCAFNTDDEAIYWYTSSGWVRATDDQDASEVNLVTAVDSDGDAANETTVEDVVQAITPITSASGRIFYPPSIAIDASTNGTANVDLYQAYLDQFSAPVVSSEAVAIPTYARTELYYYVTYADPSVFGNGTSVQNMSVNTNGVLSYEIFNQPADYNSLINVVFVVK
ncbi:MAG: hypothetical protein ED555_14295 [Allomuricauda sp.]|nr:MAG: hypothetical protein ED555_14295 [Allomuricauda sp.]